MLRRTQRRTKRFRADRRQRRHYRIVCVGRRLCTRARTDHPAALREARESGERRARQRHPVSAAWDHPKAARANPFARPTSSRRPQHSVDYDQRDQEKREQNGRFEPAAHRCISQQRRRECTNLSAIASRYPRAMVSRCYSPSALESNVQASSTPLGGGRKIAADVGVRRGRAGVTSPA
jgi:hypothetical protein